jgi:hypothetical protein
VSDVPEVFESAWVRVTEAIDENGSPTLEITHDEFCTPWQIMGMLQAAADYHRELTKNVFFCGSWEDIDFDGGDE